MSLTQKAGPISIAWLNASTKKYGIGRADLETIVARDEKGRYQILNGRIRANQGHSLNIRLDLSPITPPPELFHGTVDRFVETILAEGLNKMNRQHVHLSADTQTAVSVGNRRSGKTVILRINAAAMSRSGLEFYRSENGVWLTEHVAPRFLEVLNSGPEG